MLDLRRKFKRQMCLLCKKKKDKLSNKDYCVECSKKLNQDSVSQLRVKRGPVYERWKNNLTAAMQRL